MVRLKKMECVGRLTLKYVLDQLSVLLEIIFNVVDACWPYLYNRNGSAVSILVLPENQTKREDLINRSTPLFVQDNT